MRLLSVIMVLSLVSPMSAPVSVESAPAAGERVIIALDVCHADGSALSINGSLKGMCTDAARVSLPDICDVVHDPSRLFHVMYYPFMKDRPPQV